MARRIMPVTTLLACVSISGGLGGCALGVGSASISYYEPTVPAPAPVKVTTDAGKIQGSYPDPVHGSSQRMFSFDGVRSMTLVYPRYTLQVFSTEASYTGGGFLMLIPIPVPLPTRSQGQSVLITVAFACEHEPGCVLHPSQLKFVAEHDPPTLNFDCRKQYPRGEASAAQDGSWNVARGASVTLTCGGYLSQPMPPAISIDLRGVFVAGDAGAELPVIVMRRTGFQDPYFGGAGGL